ncbi:hypothetical protein [Vaginisenegalia massiliensis]|uniref:hypothetical protein n=1 Tax=Vaginisenegalia massiliensis TaxID=2058294 RepID=UPI000F53D26A|nr:hypothetical protein [Vaginisenegalia massiliensis]
MIALVFVSELKYCPYLRKYVDFLDKNGLEYEILFWNREEIEDGYPSNYKAFTHYSKKKKSPFRKISDFIRFRWWLKKNLDSSKYSQIIFLSTLSGMLLFDVAIKRFSNKYILDIRDFSYEHLAIFRFFEKKLVEDSFSTFISSRGFIEFLPSSKKYLPVHNFNRSELSYQKPFEKNIETPVNVVFIGGIRYFAHQKLLIDKLKNNSNFHMIYHGSGIELDIYKEYCKQNGIKNIEFTGAYNNSDKFKLLANAQILNNSYSTKKILETKYAISNKFYDGIIFGLPQIVESNSYKSEIVSEFKMGIKFNEDDECFAETLFKYYDQIDEDEFNKNREKLLNSIVEEDDIFYDVLAQFIRNEDLNGKD